MAADLRLQMCFCALFGTYIMFWGNLISCKEREGSLFPFSKQLEPNTVMLHPQLA
jgi:hypothetical protein